MRFGYALILAIAAIAVVGLEGTPLARSRLKAILAGLFAASFIFVIVRTTIVHFVIRSGSVKILWACYAINLAFLAATGILLDAGSATRHLMRKLYLAFFTLLIGLLAADILFSIVHVQSDGFDFTLASNQWFETYWKPINSLGYRDREHISSDLRGKRLVLVVGDSFVAGHGINHVKDRFSDLLQAKLGPAWDVANVAQCGWDTSDEFKAICDYPYRPNMILLSYFMNDIDGACGAAGRESPDLVAEPNPWIASLINRSYLANFTYWCLYRYHNAAELGETYSRYLQSCYADPAAWKLHRDQIEQIIHYTRTNHIQLKVVLFPDLTNVTSTIKDAGRVADVFKSEGVPVLNLAPILERRKVSDLTVNSFDLHPSVALHKEVAERLYDWLR